MKKLVLIPLIAASLAACTTATELRDKPIAFQGATERPVSKVAECVTVIFKGIRGGIVASDAIPNGVAISFNVHGQFGNIVWMIADIEDGMGRTKLTLRGIGKKSKNPEKDYANFNACLEGS